MGDAYSTLVEFDDAEAAYLKALDVDPGHVASRLGLGNVYLRSGRLSGALDQYEGILRAEPDNVTARLRLAEVHLRSGRLEESVDAANEVLRIDPADRRALYLRGTARVRLGRHDRGEADLEEFRRLETAAADEEHRELEVMSFNREAVAMVRQGRYQEAIEALEQGIEVRPDAGSLYLNLGLIRSRAGDHRGAVGTFEAMLRLGFTDDPAIHRNLTREYELLGDIDASRKHRSILLEQFGLSR
jgi:tetratricopeptide (TPR) repeat protein